MKKTFLITFSIILLTSCGEKLPTNISSALWMSNTNMNSLNQVDSIILTLSESDINNLSADSAFSLYASHENLQQSANKADKELDELLKYNPEYSDYSEIKERVYYFTISKRLSSDFRIKILNNVDKLYERSRLK
jgi:hypothetical protein